MAPAFSRERPLGFGRPSPTSLPGLLLGNSRKGWLRSEARNSFRPLRQLLFVNLRRGRRASTLLFDDPKSCGALRSTLKLFLRGCTLVALLRSVPFGPPPVAAPVLLLPRFAVPILFVLISLSALPRPTRGNSPAQIILLLAICREKWTGFRPTPEKRPVLLGVNEVVVVQVRVQALRRHR